MAKLLRAFRQLLEAGHSLLVIEHNLDVIRACDWIIDLGPEGGDAGGEVVCTGTPDEVAKHPGSHTAKALRESCMWFYELKTVANGRTKYRWERVRKLRRSMTRRPALGSGNLPAEAILLLFL